DPNDLVTQFAKFADMARREGTLALEGEIKKIEDPFLRTGLQLVVDGVDGDQVKEVMMTEIHALKDRHHAGINFFNGTGAFAPTFGLMGTIVGLVGVLADLSDPEKLGHGMALGLLGTLWGVFSANVFYLPLGSRLQRMHEAEVSVKLLTVEGVLAIREGVATRLLVERLEARLAPDMRVGHSQRAKEAA
ncbi:MAG: motility protein A, partial [Actinomycetota bacterium]